MGRACGRARRQKKHFFFEKKKQTTFSPALPSSCVTPRHCARRHTDKSFSVLFFKKEQLGFPRACHASS
jgi:hypothetical protein